MKLFQLQIRSEMNDLEIIGKIFGKIFCGKMHIRHLASLVRRKISVTIRNGKHFFREIDVPLIFDLYVVDFNFFFWMSNKFVLNTICRKWFLCSTSATVFILRLCLSCFYAAFFYFYVS